MTTNIAVDVTYTLRKGAALLTLTEEEARAAVDALRAQLDAHSQDTVIDVPTSADIEAEDIPLSESIARIENTITGRMPPGIRRTA